jgi:hypothetical protein
MREGTTHAMTAATSSCTSSPAITLRDRQSVGDLDEQTRQPDELAVAVARRLRDPNTLIPRGAARTVVVLVVNDVRESDVRARPELGLTRGPAEP